MDNEARLNRMREEWCELDEAMLASLDQLGQLPWESTQPRVIAAWDALTLPENLSDLQFRLAYYDDGAAMNDWAAKVTRKAIEVSQSRQSQHA